MWKLIICNPINKQPLYEAEGITLTKIYKKFKVDYPDSKFITLEKMRNIYGRIVKIMIIKLMKLIGKLMRTYKKKRRKTYSMKKIILI